MNYGLSTASASLLGALGERFPYKLIVPSAMFGGLSCVRVMRCGHFQAYGLSGLRVAFVFALSRARWHTPSPLRMLSCQKDGFLAGVVQR